MHTTFFGPAAERRPGQVFLPTAYRDILAGKGMVSIIESDGELSKEVAALAEANEILCICFDPTKDGCPFFNPLVGEEENVVDLVVDAYAFSNPDSPQYFKDQTELVLRNVMKVLKRLDKDKGEDGFYFTFIWLEQLISDENGQGRELVI